MKIVKIAETEKDANDVANEATDADVYGDKDGKICDINANFSANIPIKYLASFFASSILPASKISK